MHTCTHIYTHTHTSACTHIHTQLLTLLKAIAKVEPRHNTWHNMNNLRQKKWPYLWFLSQADQPGAGIGRACHISRGCSQDLFSAIRRIPNGKTLPYPLGLQWGQWIWQRQGWQISACRWPVQSLEAVSSGRTGWRAGLGRTQHRISQLHRNRSCHWASNREILLLICVLGSRGGIVGWVKSEEDLYDVHYWVTHCRCVPVLCTGPAESEATVPRGLREGENLRNCRWSLSKNGATINSGTASDRDWYHVDCLLKQLPGRFTSVQELDKSDKSWQRELS